LNEVGIKSLIDERFSLEVFLEEVNVGQVEIFN